MGAWEGTAVNPTRGGRNRWLLALSGVALVLATNGCSQVIAHSGVSSVSEIYKPQTRAEVHEAFGAADETGTCPDGRPVERRAIRQKDRSRCLADWHSGFMCVTHSPYLVLLEPLAFPVIAVRSERNKLHYAFVYGADDRVAYRYDLADEPFARFWQTVPPLPSFWSGDSVSGQVEQASGASWAGRFSAFAEEVRHRAACVDYPLTSQDEETLQLMQVLAVEVDAGRLAPDDTLVEFEWCLSAAPFSCLRP